MSHQITLSDREVYLLDQALHTACVFVLDRMINCRPEEEEGFNQMMTEWDDLKNHLKNRVPAN